MTKVLNCRVPSKQYIELAIAGGCSIVAEDGNEYLRWLNKHGEPIGDNFPNVPEYEDGAVLALSKYILNVLQN